MKDNLVTKCCFLGYPLDAITVAEVVSLARKSIRSGGICVHASLNASKVAAMRHDSALARALAKADIVTADGQSIVWAARLLGLPVPERVPGIELMSRLLDLAAAENYNVYFFGSTDKVLDDLAANLRRSHPRLKVTGSHHGYYAPVEELELLQAIRQAHPDILFVGISSPRKELLVAAHRASLGVPFIMGVGGAFEVLAGHRKRAPRLAQRLGLEWTVRFLQEPRRLWRRYLIGNTVFIWMVLVALLRRWSAHAAA
jgi:N-acetylglucosaminyldiphosphoundecaprenol N-acetyl-beta-D-mannosaminyltransferase